MWNDSKEAELRRMVDSWLDDGRPDSNASTAVRMSMLVESFHSLRGRPGVRPWSPIAFAQGAFLSAWGTPALLYAASFVLGVWNADFPVPIAFDAIDALSRWDDKHRRAFVAWAVEPWWP